MRLPAPFLVAFLLSIAFPASGHEFWIEPAAGPVAPGEEIATDLRVGQNFKGYLQLYLPNRFRRFEVILGDRTLPVPGRTGDHPALRIRLDDPGLAIAVHETGDTLLTWEDFEIFTSFVEHKDAAWAVAAHRERGISEARFSEVYSRYVKSLIAVGDGNGSDRVTGLLTEIVAEKNPYTDDLTGGLPVRVYYQQAPRGGAQVEVFDRAPDGTVTVTKLHADDNGLARVPVLSGHAYMLDSVVFREPSAEKADLSGAVWESLWANLTFAVP